MRKAATIAVLALVAATSAHAQFQDDATRAAQTPAAKVEHPVKTPENGTGPTGANIYNSGAIGQVGNQPTPYNVPNGIPKGNGSSLTSAVPCVDFLAVGCPYGGDLRGSVPNPSVYTIGGQPIPTGIAKGNGTSLSAATAGTDYTTPTGAADQMTVGGQLLSSAITPIGGHFTPQMFVPSAGSGGDDSSALNQATAAAAAVNGVLDLPPPPSGVYNVCAAPWVRPYTLSSLTIRGTGSGQNTVRIMPGCANPPAQVFLDSSAAYPTSGPVARTVVRTRIENLRLDGYCLATALNIAYDPGFSSSNVLYRNGPRGGQNILMQGGYGAVIDATNFAENINDPGHTCYNTLSDYPAYNVYTKGSDSVFSLGAQGASIANYAQAHGGYNTFLGAHGWGYTSTPNGDGQPASAPPYTYLTFGGALISSSVADSPTVAGVRTQALPPLTNAIYAATIANAGSGGTPGPVTLTGTTGAGTMFQAIGYIGANGGLVGTLLVTNMGSYTTMPTNMAAEPVTATAGLTGATLSLTLNTGFADANAATVIGLNMEGPTVSGVSVGPAAQHPTVIGSNLNNSPTCVAFDTGALPLTAILRGNSGCATYGWLAAGVGANNAVRNGIFDVIGTAGEVYVPAGGNTLAITSSSGTGYVSLPNYGVFSSGGHTSFVLQPDGVNNLSLPVVDGTGVRVALTSAGYTVPQTSSGRPSTSLVRFNQTGTVASATVALAPYPLDGQAIEFDNYAGVVTALSFSPAINGWSNGSQLNVYTAIRARWDSAASAWYRVQ